MRNRERESIERGRTTFARRLLAEWKRLALDAGRVVVAVSGGADSTALLLAFDELIKSGSMSLELTVAHLDHGLRGEAAADARWVEKLAGDLGHEFVSERASVSERARDARDNLEQAARRARYEFLGRVAREAGAQAVAVAHTLDDQAETMLLALMRGSGAEGLSGMRAVRALDASGEGALLLARPLLGWARRAETIGYCAAQGVAVRADEMNEDDSFSRVRVRKRLLPLLETFNPRVVEALGRTAMLLHADAEALEARAAKLLEAASERESKDEVKDEVNAVQTVPLSVPPLSVEVLRGALMGVRRRALRQWLAAGRGDLRRVELVHLSAVEKLLEGGRGGRMAELPGGSRVERRRGQLLFHRRGRETGES